MRISSDESLAPRTTFQLGGSAKYFCTVSAVEELRAAHEAASSYSVPVVILGGGSNILVPDEGVNALVVSCTLRGVSYEEVGDVRVRVVAGAGEVWDTLVEGTVRRGLWGIENLSHIPGLVGATPIQNVGAYGVEVSETIEWVEAFDPTTGMCRRFTNQECMFGYRDSHFKHDGSHLVVTSVAFLLSRTPSPKVGYRDVATWFAGVAEPSLPAIREAIIEIRAKKFPDLMRIGTAGSFFKNPIITSDSYEKLRERFNLVPQYPAGEGRLKVPAAFLLERCGWKGVRRGHVGTWPNQPLVLVHYGGGTTRELIKFADEIQSDVFAKTTVELEREVRVLIQT